jgi:hypothetical protein
MLNDTKIYDKKCLSDLETKLFCQALTLARKIDDSPSITRSVFSDTFYSLQAIIDDEVYIQYDLRSEGRAGNPRLQTSLYVKSYTRIREGWMQTDIDTVEITRKLTKEDMHGSYKIETEGDLDKIVSKVSKLFYKYCKPQ